MKVLNNLREFFFPIKPATSTTEQITSEVTKALQLLQIGPREVGMIKRMRQYPRLEDFCLSKLNILPEVYEAIRVDSVIDDIDPNYKLASYLVNLPAVNPLTLTAKEKRLRGLVKGASAAALTKLLKENIDALERAQDNGGNIQDQILAVKYIGILTNAALTRLINKSKQSATTTT